MYLASLGPNYTNLAECILSTDKPDFTSLIISGALDGIREIKFGKYHNFELLFLFWNKYSKYLCLIINIEGGKFDTSRRKSYGGTYLRHAVETKVSEAKIDWDSVMDATNSHLGELQDNLLLNYEAQNPNIVHLYPQAIANPAGKFIIINLYKFY